MKTTSMLLNPYFLRISVFAAIVLIPTIGIGQSKLFVAKKSAPLSIPVIDYSNGVVPNTETKTFVPSVSTDGKQLAMSLGSTKTDMSDLKNMTMTFNQLGLLIDMERGEIISSDRNSSFYFEGNNLIKGSYTDLWNKPYPIEDMTKNIFDGMSNFYVDRVTLETKPP